MRGKGAVILMSQEFKIKQLIDNTINSLGYELIQVQIFDESTKRLQIMVERLDRSHLTVEDCAVISKEISIILDINDPIGENYLLEVSSMGIDRPLLQLEDFAKYTGFDARVDMNNLFKGRKKFKGKLAGVEGDNVSIQIKEETYSLPINEIQKAKLLLTQELLDAATHD
jgi:ribosome maturation factor RimP